MAWLRYIAVDAAAAAVILLPLFLILCRCRLLPFRKASLLFLFSEYLCCLYSLVGLMTLPLLPYLRFEPNINLIPLLGIPEDWKNALLNVALFVPMGLMLPLLWQDLRGGLRTMRTGFALSLGIELLQILSGRATDINDLITNVLGTVIGYGFFRTLPVQWQAHCTPFQRKLVFALVIAVMFFVQPYIAALAY